jgi:hypothetical protein
MSMVPSSLWTHLSSVLYALLTVTHHHLVIIMSIGALRMYRGLVDSATLNGSPVWVVGAKGLSPREEVSGRPTACREQDGAGGTALDPSCSALNSQRILVVKRQDVESFGSEMV